MTDEQRRRLRSVKTFAQLISFLRDELDWPIDQGHDEDDLTFDWSDDLGLKDEERVGIKEIKQLRPLETGQPWGIFFVNFERKNLPIVILRRILNALVLKKRASANRAQQAAWQQRDLLFISAYGQESERQLTFAHFSEPANDFDPSKATLRVLGWDDDDTNLKLDYVADTLKAKLTWPTSTADLQDWRQRWSEAFELRPREVIDTAADLALRLADLAQRIRNRMLQVLPRESEAGELRKLLKGFQAALIHDLDEARFADMYAQTITYGLFSAAVSRTVPGAGTAVHQGNVVDMVPVTNPFLREMLSSFLRAGGRRGKLDFDELGIQEVVDLLNDPKTHMEAVLRDFGNRTRGEDPVIHFYEEFLKAYDKKLKVQRGVFYTPQPVVSYIVRSVHELLQTEFGLADGLADITTWGEMLKKHPDLKLPALTDAPDETRTISPDEHFVQILDPATGTATFLVEVIEVVYRTLKAKWKQQRLSEAQQGAAWNEYVPKHLLPRLHAYELMMAPYAIAHMKIGLKLAETGYRFGTDERARIYLTNALEPWVKQLPLVGFDALAHEAAAVNVIKQQKRFSVVIGNPPYAVNSANKNSPIDPCLAIYKENLAGEHNLKPLNDDYLKFLLLAQMTLAGSGAGVVGMITNHSYATARLCRGVRRAILSFYSGVHFLDLRGDMTRDPSMLGDDNVFDIQQGVAISLLSRSREPISASPEVYCHEHRGTRDSKNEWLGTNSVRSTQWFVVHPQDPFFSFSDVSSVIKGEYDAFLHLNHLFATGNIGYQTHRDRFVIDLDRAVLVERMEQFRARKGSEDQLSILTGLKSNRDWSLSEAHRLLARESHLDASCLPTLYRPFDIRYICFAPYMIDYDRRDLMRHMMTENVGLLVSKVFDEHEFTSVLVTRWIVESKAADRTRGSYLFPLRLQDADGQFEFGNQRGQKYRSNLRHEHVARIFLQFEQIRNPSSSESLDDGAIFHYVYAVLYSPTYRSRYAEFLKIDFPRLPLTGNLELFRTLARLGGELSALHLLESPRLAQPITEFVGGSQPVVEKISWSRDTVWVDKAQTIGFEGVRENVWNFHIGGYKVCEKWLKDRKGRTLSNDDIAHYQKIVVALSETIRLMAEIDRVIEAHGGWPGAFQATTTA